MIIYYAIPRLDAGRVPTLFHFPLPTKIHKRLTYKTAPDGRTTYVMLEGNTISITKAGQLRLRSVEGSGVSLYALRSGTTEPLIIPLTADNLFYNQAEIDHALAQAGNWLPNLDVWMSQPAAKIVKDAEAIQAWQKANNYTPKPSKTKSDVPEALRADTIQYGHLSHVGLLNPMSLTWQHKAKFRPIPGHGGTLFSLPAGRLGYNSGKIRITALPRGVSSVWLLYRDTLFYLLNVGEDLQNISEYMSEFLKTTTALEQLHHTIDRLFANRITPSSAL